MGFFDWLINTLAWQAGMEFGASRTGQRLGNFLIRAFIFLVGFIVTYFVGWWLFGETFGGIAAIIFLLWWMKARKAFM